MFLHEKPSGDDLHQQQLTSATAALGDLTSPLVAASHSSSRGNSLSSHAKEKSGESHLTMDDGSSNRIIRLSKLCE